MRPEPRSRTIPTWPRLSTQLLPLRRLHRAGVLHYAATDATAGTQGLPAALRSPSTAHHKHEAYCACPLLMSGFSIRQPDNLDSKEYVAELLECGTKGGGRWRATVQTNGTEAFHSGCR